MTVTALDIITGASRLIGVTFVSETLPADDANDALLVLNDMLDSWSNDGLMTYSSALENFSLTGATSYTIGSGGTFNTTRPINILSAVVRLSNVDYPLEIITQDQYQLEINNKSVTSSTPQYLTYDNAYPLGTIKMFPIPSSGSTLYLDSFKPLSNLTLLTTTVDLPPGWKRALKYNLAIELAPHYGVEPTATIVRNALRSMGAIKASTSANNAMPFMPSPIARYSILSGTE